MGVLGTSLNSFEFSLNDSAYEGEDVHVVGVLDMNELANSEANETVLDDADHDDYVTVSIGFVVVVLVLFLVAVVLIIALSLYNIFVAAPLQTGYMRFNLDLFKTRKEVSINRMLYGFRNGYSRSAGTCFRLGMIYVGVALLWLWAPMALGIVGWALKSTVIVLVGLLALLVAFFAWTIASIKISLEYSMSYYLLADHPEMTGREALKASKAMMKGHKWRLLRLRLSFLGWLFLSWLTVGIGLLWVGPYMQAADTAFYRELAKGGKKQSFLENLFR
jgi:uncharacterized membrane protein